MDRDTVTVLFGQIYPWGCFLRCIQVEHGIWTTEVLPSASIVDNDIYSLILRQMILKEPKRVELLDWIISLRSREMSLAAESILDNSKRYSETIAPLRALLISMLYPSMKLDEALESLREEEGYSNIQKTKDLLTIYYNLLT